MNRNMNVATSIYKLKLHIYLMCLWLLLHESTFCFIENLKMKFQIRNVLYSSGTLYYFYINENEMKKYQQLWELILKVWY